MIRPSASASVTWAGWPSPAPEGRGTSSPATSTWRSLCATAALGWRVVTGRRAGPRGRPGSQRNLQTVRGVEEKQGGGGGGGYGGFGGGSGGREGAGGCPFPGARARSRKRSGAAAELPRRDPRPGRHAGGRVRVPDPL